MSCSDRGSICTYAPESRASDLSLTWIVSTNHQLNGVSIHAPPFCPGSDMRAGHKANRPGADDWTRPKRRLLGWMTENRGAGCGWLALETDDACRRHHRSDVPNTPALRPSSQYEGVGAAGISRMTPTSGHPSGTRCGPGLAVPFALRRMASRLPDNHHPQFGREARSGKHTDGGLLTLQVRDRRGRVVKILVDISTVHPVSGCFAPAAPGLQRKRNRIRCSGPPNGPGPLRPHIHPPPERCGI